MKAGTIVRLNKWIGVVTGETPMGSITCLLGGETKQFTLTTSRKSLKPVEIIDLDRDELENALALMQAFARELVDNAKPF